VTAKAVGGHATALARLETACSRRAEVVARQDVLVAAAAAEVATAVVEAARVMGVDVAATVLDLRKTEVHHILKEAQIKEAQ
jgi:malonyl CoA-acyl carrier protein transacylase